MRALILTCNTGGGHNAAAAAIREALEAQGDEAEVCDSLRFISPRASSLISGWHTRIYRHLPRAFDSGYSFAEQHPSVFEDGSPLYRYLASGAEALFAFLEAGGYGVVVCVHVFSAVLVAQLRRRYAALPACLVATDYTCSPIVCECGMDRLFIPHEGLWTEFCGCGADPARLRVSGIPVRRAFRSREDPAEARRRLGLPEGAGHVLLMGGSMGCAHLEELAETVAARLPAGALLSVVCGTNERLRARLERRRAPNMRVYGFTDEVPLLLDSAALFLTKPGGVSITEAAVKRVPLLLLDTVGGCEARNRAYFTARGWAESAGGPDEAAERVAAMLAAGAAAPETGLPEDGAQTIAAEARRLARGDRGGAA